MNIYRTPNGQLTKFQPLLNEVAAAMLSQILNMNVSTQRESSMWKPDAYLIDDVSSSSVNALDSGTSSSRLSGVTLAEVTPRSALSSSQIGPRYSYKSVQNGPTEVHSQSHTQATPVMPPQYPELELISSGDNSAVTDFSDHLGIPMNIGLPGVSFGEPEMKMGSLHPAMLPGGGSSTHSNSDSVVDAAAKLASIDDVFWEQFLLTIPLTGETDEMSSVVDDGIASLLEFPEWKGYGTET